MKNILVIGSANMDLTIFTDRMPKLGETVTGYDFSLNCGGKGANQAVAAAKLGGSVSFIGALGNDAYGDTLIENFKQHIIKFEGVVSDKVSTGTASITVVGGDNFIILNEGANGIVAPELIEEKADLIKEADFLIMQLEIPAETVARAAEIAKSGGTAVVINPAPMKEMPDSLFAATDIMIPNEHEAELLTGIAVRNKADAEKAIKAIRSKGVKTVIITLGEKGCVYNVGEEIFEH
ncbi:MAG: ribokinase, partial [Acutalibacteraceae bacterium]